MAVRRSPRTRKGNSATTSTMSHTTTTAQADPFAGAHTLWLINKNSPTHPRVRIPLNTKAVPFPALAPAIKKVGHAAAAPSVPSPRIRIVSRKTHAVSKPKSISSHHSTFTSASKLSSESHKERMKKIEKLQGMIDEHNAKLEAQMKLWNAGLEAAAGTIIKESDAAFNQLAADHEKGINAAKDSVQELFRKVNAIANLFETPLGNEQIETTVSKNGKPKTSVVEIGKRVAGYLEAIEHQAIKLKTTWEQWESVQKEFRDLGAEVLGFVDGIAATGPSGFGEEVKLLGAEVGASVEQLKSVVSLIGKDCLNKMAASEKDLAATLNKEKAQLIASMIQ